MAFAERGLDAQIDEIARDAGVGVGTVYRHFETKEALLEAVAIGPLLGLVQAAQDALAAADPGPAFEGFFLKAAAIQVNDRCMGQTGVGPLADSATVTAARHELGEAVGALLARAQSAGAIRPDVGLADIPMLIFGIGAGAEMADCIPRSSWERHAEIVLGGLRARDDAGGLTPA